MIITVGGLPYINIALVFYRKIPAIFSSTVQNPCKYGTLAHTLYACCDT